MVICGKRTPTVGGLVTVCAMGRETRVETYAELAATIRSRSWRRTGFVAVDVPGGAGKSTCAARLARALGGVPVVHTDDFAAGEAGAAWWPRLHAEVIEPLAAGRSAGQIAAGDLVVIEGVSSGRRPAAPYLTYAIWVHASRELRRRRGLERDGEQAATEWARLMAEEDAHFAADKTLGRAEAIVDGAPSLAHDPETAFVRLDSAPGG